MKRFFMTLISAILLFGFAVGCTPTQEQPPKDSDTEETTTVPEQTSPEETADGATTEEEDTAEEETTEEDTTEEETTIVYAGEDSGLVRDGTPKKYFTLSFDDGTTQDLKIIEILKKYDVDCITFNINTGLYGANWTWVADAVGKPGLSHLRFTEEELKTGIYDGYDVAVHTRTHPSLKTYDSDRNPRRIIQEVQGDADAIYGITGIYPVGMAWPGGDTEYTDKTISDVYKNTTIRFGRGITSTYGFKLPEYFLKWQPTCSITDQRLMTLANQFIAAECEDDMLFYVWGHGYELDQYDYYDEFEALIKLMSEQDDIVLVTNSEFYQLFKDEIPAWHD